MSDSSAEYVHMFPNLEVYPRIYYFHRRYCDLLARFSRVTGALPKCFKDDNLMCQLDRLKEEFQGGIKILVVGRDIDDIDLVYNADLKSDRNHPYRIEMVVLHVSPKLLNRNEYEITKARYKAFFLDAEKADHKTFVFIKCDVPALRDDLEEYLNGHTCIFIDNSDENMRATISDRLETYLAVGFLKIDSHVRLFESRYIGVCLDSSYVFENDSVARLVRTFISNARAYVEVKINPGEKENTYDLIYNHLRKSLAQFIRCSLADPFAKRFGLQVWICNGVLCEVHFEEALLGALYKDYIKQMANCVYEALSKKTEYSIQAETIENLYKDIKSDVRPAIENVEKKLHSMQRLSVIFRKMAFETRSYLNQLNIEQSVVEHLPKISKELRQKLLSIDGVYGLGNVYGRLEIHVNRDKDLASNSFGEKHDANNEKSTNDISNTAVPDLHKDERKDLTKLTSEIASHMHQHHFSGQYTVKFIEKKPIEMVSSFEPGDRLFERKREKFGTLGGFVVTRDGKVHGLTCAHVVGVKERMFIDKDGPVPFSSCPKKVNRENCILKHIDIAALEVIPLIQQRCIKTLQECNECISKAVLSYEHPETIAGSPVFKYGAASGSTKGFVVSVDYSIFGPEAEDYLVIIDIQPDLPTDFGENFDPITCVNDPLDGEDNNSIINHDRTVLRKNDRELTSISDDGITDGKPSTNSGCTSTTIYERNETNTVQTMECKSSNSNEIDQGICAHGSTIVYVRSISYNQTLNSNDSGNSGEVFAKKGDSGSIVCIHEAMRDNINHKALSMLYAGDFKIDGDESMKCLSFKLNVGLQMLKQTYGLDF